MTCSTFTQNTSFPVEHRRQIWSTNSLERLNKEVSRKLYRPNNAELVKALKELESG